MNNMPASVYSIHCTVVYCDSTVLYCGVIQQCCIVLDSIAMVEYCNVLNNQ